MKKLSYLLIPLLILSCSESNLKSTVVQQNTALNIKNSSALDSVEVFVTLQSTEDVYGMWGIKNHGSKGSFFALKDSTYTHSSNTAIKGFLISFGNDCGACDAPTTPKHGVNVFEGTVNTEFEAIDISAMDGVNSIMRLSVDQDNWIVGTTGKSLTSTQNKSFGENCNITCVFPYQCTDCVKIISPPPPCNPTIPVVCNKERICQANRHDQQGGNVLIEFLEFTK
tara:strand:- start:208 stop:882 length:675 start_codon:yes stop_codon:yes gene_type:complete